jgi:hypothetical protein
MGAELCAHRRADRPAAGGYIASLNVGVQWNFYAFAAVAALAAMQLR